MAKATIPMSITALTELSDGTKNTVIVQVVGQDPIQVWMAASIADISAVDYGHRLLPVSVPSITFANMIAAGMKIFGRPEHVDGGRVIVTQY